MGEYMRRQAISGFARETLFQAARAVGIDGFLATGKWGTFQSSARDTVMLPIYAETGVWEEGCNQALIDFFANRSGTYIDIGANIGLTTVPVAQNPTVTCVAFEPDPTNHANLVENIRRNCSSGNVIVHQTALFDTHATLAFSLSPDNMGDHRIATAHDSGRHQINVNAAPLNSILNAGFKEPLAIKMDVQGAEPAVLRGARATLARAELAIVEFCPFMIDHLGEDPTAVFDFLSTFSTIGLLEVGSPSGSVFSSAEQAVNTLRRSFEEQKHREDWYVDVFASKSKGFSFERYLRPDP